MISLVHLNGCEQIINLGNLSLDGKRRFITDTRIFKQGDAFIAIPGQKVNPLNLVSNLLANGCDLVFYQHNQENEQIVKKYQSEYKANFIPVKDSVAFIQELAHQHIKEWLKDKSHTLFAISGSNGKTTHKEMLSHIMENILPDQVVSTQKNNNNHLGVPLTLFNVNDETKFIVLELGSNHPGEIKFLCDLSLPNAGLTTNIGATHLEFFGTEEAVFHEEGYLYYAVKENTNGEGFYLINNDDDFLKSLKDTKGSVRFGSSQDSQVKMHYLTDGARLGDIEVHNSHITGNHNKSNLATCAYIACHFFPTLKDKIVAAASTFKPTPNRSQWLDKGEAKVFLDAYNANPSSMRVALQGFRDQVKSQGFDVKECCVVLGDMNELGPKSAEYHHEIGAFAASLGFENLFFIGRFANSYIEGAKKGQSFVNVQEFKKSYQENYLARGGYHFIKGSRSLQLESLFDIT